VVFGAELEKFTHIERPSSPALLSSQKALREKGAIEVVFGAELKKFTHFPSPTEKRCGRGVGVRVLKDPHPRPFSPRKKRFGRREKL
jgi:hypothetical protein